VGIDIFVHAVRLVLGDWRNAVRISGLLYLIYAIPSLILQLLFPPLPETASAADVAAALATAPVGLLIAIFALVAFVWIAVAWHRYVLLDEMPAGQFPEFNGSRLVSYAVYSLGIGLLAVIAAILVGIVAGLVVAIVPPLAFLAALVALAAALIVGYRFAALLPASAVGKPLTFGAAWEATKGANRDIIVLAMVSVIAAFIIDLPALIFAFAGPVGGFLALIWTLGTGWVKMLVGVSILTTLYGHFVEGRAIPPAR
jgi:hypothetical protein